MLTPEQKTLQEKAKNKINTMNEKPVQQNCPAMAFGKYKRQSLEGVPASYLFWAWENAECLDRYPEIKGYIEKNLTGIKKQIMDGTGQI